VFIRGMFGKSWRTSGLQEGGFADVALDVLGLLVHFELRLGYFGVFVLAITLGGCFGAVSHVCG